MSAHFKRGPTILLVDDDPLQLSLREAVLREAGFEVAVATSAEVALALLAAPTQPLRIGAVITDHLLPGASGAEFARTVKKTHPRLPIVVLTGLPGAQEEYTGLDVTFLMKPANPEELVAVMQRVTGKAAA